MDDWSTKLTSYIFNSVSISSRSEQQWNQEDIQNSFGCVLLLIRTVWDSGICQFLSNSTGTMGNSAAVILAPMWPAGKCIFNILEYHEMILDREMYKI